MEAAGPSNSNCHDADAPTQQGSEVPAGISRRRSHTAKLDRWALHILADLENEDGTLQQSTDKVRIKIFYDKLDSRGKRWFEQRYGGSPSGDSLLQVNQLSVSTSLDFWEVFGSYSHFCNGWPEYPAPVQLISRPLLPRYPDLQQSTTAQQPRTQANQAQGQGSFLRSDQAATTRDAAKLLRMTYIDRIAELCLGHRLRDAPKMFTKLISALRNDSSLQDTQRNDVLYHVWALFQRLLESPNHLWASSKPFQSGFSAAAEHIQGVFARENLQQAVAPLQQPQDRSSYLGSQDDHAYHETRHPINGPWQQYDYSRSQHQQQYNDPQAPLLYQRQPVQARSQPEHQQRPEYSHLLPQQQQQQQQQQQHPQRHQQPGALRSKPSNTVSGPSQLHDSSRPFRAPLGSVHQSQRDDSPTRDRTDLETDWQIEFMRTDHAQRKRRAPSPSNLSFHPHGQRTWQHTSLRGRADQCSPSPPPPPLAEDLQRPIGPYSFDEQSVVTDHIPTPPTPSRSGSDASPAAASSLEPADLLDQSELSDNDQLILQDDNEGPPPVLDEDREYQDGIDRPLPPVDNTQYEAHPRSPQQPPSPIRCHHVIAVPQVEPCRSPTYPSTKGGFNYKRKLQAYGQIRCMRCKQFCNHLDSNQQWSQVNAPSDVVAPRTAARAQATLYYRFERYRSDDSDSNITQHSDPTAVER